MRQLHIKLRVANLTYPFEVTFEVFSDANSDLEKRDGRPIARSRC